MESVITTLSSSDMLQCILAKNMAKFLNQLINSKGVEIDDLERHSKYVDVAKTLTDALRAKC